MFLACVRLTVGVSHIIEQNGDWSTQRHVVYDLLGADVLILFILHEDGQKALGLPGHFLSLRGQHAHAAHVLPEVKRFSSRKRRREALLFIAATALRSNEGVDLLSLLHDENTHVPFAVVAHLAGRARVPHVGRRDITGRTEVEVGRL